MADLVQDWSRESLWPQLFSMITSVLQVNIRLPKHHCIVFNNYKKHSLKLDSAQTYLHLQYLFSTVYVL
jgi:hypothetical protein